MRPTALCCLVARAGGGSGCAVSTPMAQAWRKFVGTDTRIGGSSGLGKFASRDSIGSTRHATSIRSITSKSLPPPTAASSPQTLHQSIQDGLLKKSAVTSSASGTSTGNAAATAKTPLVDQERLERNRRYQQAAINAVCSFMVVLLAAQSLKSGTDKRKAELQLEAALEVVSETRDKLKVVLDTSTSRRIAHACLEQMHDTHTPTSLPTSSAWFWSRRSSAISVATSLEKSQEMDRLAAIVQQQLRVVIGDAALTEAERDQLQMQALSIAAAAAANQAEAAVQLATPVLDADTDRILQQALSSSAASVESLNAVENNAALDPTGKDAGVVKKRVFSM
jgi:hypothetical protein